MKKQEDKIMANNKVLIVDDDEHIVELIKLYMDKEGFEKNACLINDDTFLETYGSQSYFVNESWLNNQV